MQHDQLALRTTLALRDHPQVKIINQLGRVVRRVNARAALFLASSSDYEWDGKTGRRIKAIRALRLDRPYVPCWRNRGDGAAVLYPSADYWRNVA